MSAGCTLHATASVLLLKGTSRIKFDAFLRIFLASISIYKILTKQGQGPCLLRVSKGKERVLAKIQILLRGHSFMR